MTTIVDIAVSNSDFSTLVAAVSAANLVDALQSPGPLQFLLLLTMPLLNYRGGQSQLYYKISPSLRGF